MVPELTNTPADPTWPTPLPTSSPRREKKGPGPRPVLEVGLSRVEPGMVGGRQ